MNYHPRVLRAHEPPPVEVLRPSATSPLVLVCDHASKRIPESLGTLGLPPAEPWTHIGWDIGAQVVARRLSDLLDAPLVLSRYSRLVIDCNRPPEVASSVPQVTGGVRVRGNESVSHAEREDRIQTFFRPYHAAVSDLLEARSGLGKEAVLISVHSFTPVLCGVARPWNIGLLYGEDSRLAHPIRDALRADLSLRVGDNEPYRVSGDTDYTIPVHGLLRGIRHTAIEIRQDGIATDEGAFSWASRLAAIVRDLIGQ